MAYNFDYVLKTWADEGVKSAPSEGLRVLGLEPKMRLPAGLFNYQWDRIIRAIIELQNYTSENLQAQIDSKSDGEHTHEEYALAEHTHSEYATKEDLEGVVVGDHTHDQYTTYDYVNNLIKDYATIEYVDERMSEYVPTTETITMTGTDENGTSHSWTIYGASGNYVPTTETLTMTGVDEDGASRTWTIYGTES